ncbi:MAG TPA: PLP-dependent aminotransferase family protein [Candidatus Dormibacteraeota bacterium]|jgi:GntR family transcriptional regulator/MocR family aminotransferase|nr:PLP-dependent aminotransferase family protein [Candidatus Dormibacteraeota bacterium]
MDVHVSLSGRGELTGQIYSQLRAAILDRRLRPGERLPPTRLLAQRLRVSRNTVSTAYDQLMAEGFLVGRTGAGTYVCGSDSLPPAQSRSAPSGEVHPRPVWDSLPLWGRTRVDAEYDFRAGSPDVELFPLEAWRRLMSREFQPRSLRRPAYGPSAGHGGLRAAVARYVGVSRSVSASPEDVVITQGAQQALDLIGRVLIEPGDCVAVEEPGYPPARRLFHSLGARVVGVPVDGEGIDVAAIPDEARLVYTTPSHQFPMGAPMSLPRRTALLGWAESRDAVLIEDDYDSEFRFEQRSLEPLQSLDRGGRVAYVGSFSKTMLPELRLGFLIAPISLQSALRSAKQLTDHYGELFTQAAMAAFIDGGMLARHVRRATQHYGARRAEILGALHDDLAEWLEPVPSAAGLHVCALVRPGTGIEAADVVERVRSLGVAIEELAHYCAEKPPIQGLIIGYGGIPTERVGEGLRRLRCGLLEAARG